MFEITNTIVTFTKFRFSTIYLRILNINMKCRYKIGMSKRPSLIDDDRKVWEFQDIGPPILNVNVEIRKGRQRIGRLPKS
jgi:hypothetical protein